MALTPQLSRSPASWAYWSMASCSIALSVQTTFLGQVCSNSQRLAVLFASHSQHWHLTEWGVSFGLRLGPLALHKAVVCVLLASC